MLLILKRIGGYRFWWKKGHTINKNPPFFIRIYILALFRFMCVVYKCWLAGWLLMLLPIQIPPINGYTLRVSKPDVYVKIYFYFFHLSIILIGFVFFLFCFVWGLNLTNKFIPILLFTLILCAAVFVITPFRSEPDLSLNFFVVLLLYYITTQFFCIYLVILSFLWRIIFKL